MNSLHRIAKEFCQQAENDRKEVAAAITPLWVIRGDNLGVAGVSGSGTRQKAAFLRGETANFAAFRLEISLGGNGNLIEDGGPLFPDSGGVGFFVEGVAGDQGKGQGGLGEDHLLVGEVDFAPAAGFFEGGS